MPTTLLLKNKLLMPKKNSDKGKAHQELIAPSEILVDSIIILGFVKIGMIQDTVLLVIVAYIFMIDQIIKRDGSNKKIFKGLKNKDGEE